MGTLCQPEVVGWMPTYLQVNHPPSNHGKSQTPCSLPCQSEGHPPLLRSGEKWELALCATGPVFLFGFLSEFGAAKWLVSFWFPNQNGPKKGPCVVNVSGSGVCCGKQPPKRVIHGYV